MVSIDHISKSEKLASCSNPCNARSNADRFDPSLFSSRPISQRPLPVKKSTRSEKGLDETDVNSEDTHLSLVNQRSMEAENLLLDLVFERHDAAELISEG